MKNNNPDVPVTVELRVAKIPAIGQIAVHYWYVIREGEETERWEVWQKPSQCQTSWGHVHLNLLSPERGVGNGPGWLETTWNGETAAKLAAIIRETPQTYPHRHKYRYWPGPNSNSYVQWILDQAQVPHMLLPQAIGKNHHGLISKQNNSVYSHFSTPLFGYRHVKTKAFEWHICHLAVTLHYRPLRLRLGLVLLK